MAERRQKPHAKQIGQDMANKPSSATVPDWVDPANDRKTPYTDAELDMLAAAFIVMNGDTPAWRALVADVGEQEAVAEVKKRLAARDPRSLINWLPEGAMH